MSQLFGPMFNGKINNKFLKYYPNFKNLIAISVFQLKISGTNSFHLYGYMSKNRSLVKNGAPDFITL